MRTIAIAILVACGTPASPYDVTKQPEFRIGLARARDRAFDVDDVTIEHAFHEGYVVGWGEAIDLAVEVPRGFSEKGCAIAIAAIRDVRPFPPPLDAHMVCDARFVSVRPRFRGPRFVLARASSHELRGHVIDAFDVGYEFGFRRVVRETDMTNVARKHARDACVAVLIEENEAWPFPLDASIARCETGADSSVQTPW